MFRRILPVFLFCGLCHLSPAVSGHLNASDSLSVIHIDWDAGFIGTIKTPNFPRAFSLPTRYVWIFDNRVMKEDHPWYLHIYFTQLYLAKNLFTISTLNSTSDVIRQDMNWTELDGLGKKLDLDWFEISHLRSDDDIVILKLNVDSQTYDNLHRWSLDVDNVYGFNITFQGSNSPEVAEDHCTFGKCNLNGQCYADVSGNQKLSFRCECATPKFNPSLHDEPFSGDRCQYHVKHNECRDANSRTCANGGACRYYSSRYVVCDCPSSWTGSKCEIMESSNSAVIDPQTVGQSNKCSDRFVKVEILEPSISESVLLHAKKEFPDLLKIHTPFPGASAVLYIKSRKKIFTEFESELRSKLNKFLKHLRITESKLCVEKSLRLTTEDNKDFVTEGHEFSLSCIAHGFRKPHFVWSKDNIFMIFSNLTGGRHFASTIIVENEKEKNRHIKIMPMIQDEDTVASFLTVKPANNFDDGMFHCEVYETFGEGIDVTNLSKFPVSSSSFKVDVLQRPKIEVFPMTATINIEADYQGPKVLSCFADKSVDRILANNSYEFYWQKDGRNITDIQDRTEHEDKMVEPPGVSLTLGHIKTSAKYTCVAVNKRNLALRTEVSVTVKVSMTRNARDFCYSATLDEVVWPQTYQGTKAYIPCTKAAGYMYLTCENGNPPQWSQQKPNRSECVSEDLINWQNKIDRLLSGYIRNPSEVKILLRFFKIFRNITRSRPLTVVERKTTFKILRQIFNVVGSKNLSIDVETLANEFLTSCLPSLQSGASKNLANLIELMNLLQLSAQVFSTKIESPIDSEDETGYFEWTQPSTNKCSNNSDIILQLVDVSPSRQNAFRSSYYYPAYEFRNDVRKNQDSSDRLTNCGTSPRVSISLKGRDKKFISKTNPTLAIIHFKEIEKEIGKIQEDIMSDGRHVNYSAVSSLVTVVYGQNSAQLPNPYINMTIKFPEVVYARENDSLNFNLSCGRVNWYLPLRGELVKGPLWIRNETRCKLIWAPDGMMCSCDVTGTFAIITSKFHAGNSTSKGSGHHYLVTLCCAGGITLIMLTFAVLVSQLREKLKFAIFTQAQLSALSGGSLMVVIVILAEFFESSNFYLSTTLQLFMLSSVLSQVNIPATMYLKILSHKHLRQMKAALVGFSFFLPAMYLSITMALLYRDKTDHSKVQNEEKVFQSWSINNETSIFAAYLILLASIFLLYCTLCLVVIRNLKTDMNYIRCYSEIKKSFLVTIIVCLLNLSIMLYENTGKVFGSEVLLAVVCALVGVVIFYCYILKDDQLRRTGLQTWRKSLSCQVGLAEAEKLVEQSFVGQSSEEFIRSSSVIESASLLMQPRYQRTPERGNTLLVSNVSRLTHSNTIQCFDEVDSKNSTALTKERLLQELQNWNRNYKETPKPLSELLRSAEKEQLGLDVEIAELTKAFNGVSYASSCSSYDSALPRSRKNTATVSSGSATMRSNSSQRSDTVEGEAPKTMAAGYVIMRSFSNWSPPEGSSSSSEENQELETHDEAKETRLALLEHRAKFRQRQFSTDESATLSSEHDCNYSPISSLKKKEKPVANSTIYREKMSTSGSHANRKKRHKRPLATTQSLPFIKSEPPI